MNHHHQKAAQRNLSYQLAESIGRQILAGQIAPGAILPGEMELGEMYGVSRTAVREAVKMLAAKACCYHARGSEPGSCLVVTGTSWIRIS